MRDDLMAAQARNEALRRELEETRAKLEAAERALAARAATQSVESLEERQRREAAERKLAESRAKLAEAEQRLVEAPHSEPRTHGFAIGLAIVVILFVLGLTAAIASSSGSDPLRVLQIGGGILAALLVLGSGFYWLFRSGQSRGHQDAVDPPDFDFDFDFLDFDD